MSGAVKKRAIALVGTVDEVELSIRVIEALGGFKRPEGLTSAEVLAQTPPDVVTGSRRVARAALTYIAECLAKGERLQ